MGVRQAPRPFQPCAQGFLPQFETKPPRRQPMSPEVARLGPLFSGAIDAEIEEIGQDGEATGEAGAPAVPDTREVAGRDIRSTPAPRPLFAASAVPRRRRATGLLRALLWSGALGFRAKPRTPTPAAQGELSLATVQVKRNDLLEADLELVWGQAEPTETSRATEVPEQAGTMAAATGAGANGRDRRKAGSSWWRWWGIRSR